MDRGTWWTTVHGSQKSQTWLSTHTPIVTMMMMFKTKLSSSQQKMLLLTFLSSKSESLETCLPHSCICPPPHISVVVVVFNVILLVFLHVFHLYLSHCHPCCSGPYYHTSRLAVAIALWVNSGPYSSTYFHRALVFIVNEQNVPGACTMGEISSKLFFYFWDIRLFIFSVFNYNNRCFMQMCILFYFTDRPDGHIHVHNSYIYEYVYGLWLPILLKANFSNMSY